MRFGGRRYQTAPLLALGLALLWMGGTPGPARSEVVFDGSLGAPGPAPELPLPDGGIDYRIDHTRGHVLESENAHSAHLFHSLHQLRVEAGNAATFTGPSTIANVFVRVTGGETSRIDGALRSTIGSADLYLLNPSGVLFGPTSTLQLPGSLYVTTADRLSFADDSVFESAMGGEVPLLEVAPPTAFGFLGAQPARDEPLLRVQGILDLGVGETFSLVGEGIEIAGQLVFSDGVLIGSESGLVRAPGGHIDFISVVSPGEVALGHEPPDLTGFASLGDVLVNSGAGLEARDFTIRADEFRLQGLDKKVTPALTAVTRGDQDAKALDVEARSLIRIADGTIGSRTVASGGSADIILTAPAIEVKLEGLILAGTDSPEVGRLGDVIVNAQDSLSIAIDADRPGVGPTTGIFTVVRGAAGGGGIRISVRNENGTGELSVGPRSGIQITNEMSGAAEAIEIDADRVSVSGGGIIQARVLPTPEGPALVGSDVRIHADRVSVSGSEGGPAGRSAVESRIEHPGVGGVIRIETSELSLRDGGRIFSISDRRDQGSGDAGDIRIEAGRLIVEREAEVASATRTSGRAGDVFINAKESIALRGTDVLGAVFGNKATGLFSLTSVADGHGGTIRVITPDLVVREGALISTATFVEGTGGDLHVDAERIRVSGGGAIDSSTLLRGDGGNTVLTASQSIVVEGQDSRGRPSRVGSVTLTTGDAGNVTLITPQLFIDEGIIATTTIGLANFQISGAVTVRDVLQLLLFPGEALEDGTAGEIVVNAGSVGLRNGGAIESSSFSGAGAGRVLVEADDSFSASGQSSGIFSRPGSGGSGGGIDLTAGRVELHDGARLFVAGGESSVDASRFLAGVDSVVDQALAEFEQVAILVEFGIVPVGDDVLAKLRAARPVGESQDAGTIFIETDVLEIVDAGISAGAQSTNGGNVTIRAKHLVDIVDGAIDASVEDGTGGNIDIDPVFVILDGARILAEADAGRGGAIQIATDVFLASPDSVVSASAGDPRLSGFVEINSPDVDVAGTITTLPRLFLDAAALLHDACAAREVERAGSFVTRTREGVPVEPGVYLPDWLAETPASIPESAESAAIRPRLFGWPGFLVDCGDGSSMSGG